MYRRAYDDFVSTIESTNTAKVAKSMSGIGDYDYSNISLIELEQIVLSLKPRSPKSITTICYVMSSFAKYIKNNDMVYMIRDIDRKALWLRAKPLASKKFISYNDFIDIWKEIGDREEHNALYQQTLFRCVYEGIYCDDMSVLKNLRSSDVQDDTVTIKEDNGSIRMLNISSVLADDLKRLGEDSVWWRNNRYGVFKINIKGLHKDSCFKIEDRNGISDNQGRYSYYRILRKISKEYIGYSLLPLQLYISGIMYRIGLILNNYKYSIEEAFSDNNKDRKVNKVISDELKRSGYNIEVRNFREIVKGHIDVFAESMG